MRIIGIDPGTYITGFGIVDYEGNRIQHVDNGGIRPDGNLNLAERLSRIYCDLAELLETHHPQIAVIENVFVAKNVRSSLLLGHARGVAMLAAAQAGLKITEYNPTEVKQAVVGQGRATKQQIQQMVRVILDLPEIAIEDASDALAAAICHCHGSGLKQRIEKAVAGRWSLVASSTKSPATSN